eukprot:11164596-Lingulodinium_polyedra.AAC.1
MQFTFAGGEQDVSNTVLNLPVPCLANEPITVQTVKNNATPILLGADTQRKLGLVIDYSTNQVYSHRLARMVPS